MIGKKINQLATELAPVSTDLTIIGDPISGVSKKITLAQLGAIFSGAVSFYTNLAGFPATGDINVIYCAKDTQKLYLWSGSAYVEVFPSQALLDTYQLRSEKGVSNGYASLDSSGKVPISQLPSSIMEYKGTWSAATNTPTLANGTGDTGDVYICNVAGTVNFGAGPITFAVGDYVIYSGSIWQRSSGAVGTVTSVAASITGNAIGITGSPVTTSGTLAFAFAGTGTQYIKGDGTLATFPSTIAQAERLITEVYNSTGATLTKGTIVYINGGQGNLPTVTKALATGDSTSAQTFGVVQADITNNNNGYVVVAGKLSDLDTQAYTEGTQLYLSATTAGTWTSTKQYAPNHLVYVGIVVRAHPTQGIVEIKIQNGYELDELHDVAAQNPDNNDILQYKTSTSLWTKVAGTTSNIAEGSNLYYTDARSRAALSLTTTGSSGAASYNNTTGVLNIPNYGSALTGYVPYTGATANVNLGTYDLLSRSVYIEGTASYQAGLLMKQINGFNFVTGTYTQVVPSGIYDLYVVHNQTNGTRRRYAISVASLQDGDDFQYLVPRKSGTFAMTSDIPSLTGYVQGSGTTNYLPKFTGTSTIGNSQVFDNGTNVGVNTTSLNAKFTVENTASGSLGTGIVIRNSASTVVGTESRLFLSTVLGDNRGAYISAIITSGSNDNALLFGTNTAGNAPSEKMRLDASGNLGLGVTPSAWDTTLSKAIQLNGGSLWGYSTSQINLLQNAFYNTSGDIAYVNSASASAYRQISGVHSWHTAPSGTAGNAISFTQAMTLNASGNLSIGNTNDTYKLDVSGTGRFTGAYGTGAGLTVSGTTYGTVATNRGASSASAGMGYFSVGSQKWFAGIYENSDNFGFYSVGLNGFPLILNYSTGAATFSSSVTAGGKITSATGAFRAGGFYIPYSTSSTSSRTWAVTNDEVVFGDFSILTSTTQTGDVNLYRLYINPAGNVGIGTTSPIYKFEVSDGTRTGVFNPNSSLDGFFIGTYQAKPLIFGTGDTERARITSGGNVGIGTTSPTGKLDIFSSSDVYTNITTSGNSTSAVLSLYNSSGVTDGAAICYNVAMRFGTVTGLNGSGFTERMRITSGGNVGIGTTNPVAPLTITSAFEAFRMNGAGTSQIYQAFANSGGNYFLGVSSSTGGGLLGGQNAYSLCLVTESARDIAFGTGNVERMRIKSNGIINLSNVPSSSAGLSSGDIYKTVAGVLMIV